MRIKITDVNFTKQHEWIFKLVNEFGDVYYIMNELFYKKHNLKTPITKRELDNYVRGQWINASVENIEDIKVVIGFW